MNGAKLVGIWDDFPDRSKGRGIGVSHQILTFLTKMIDTDVAQISFDITSDDP